MVDFSHKSKISTGNGEPKVRKNYYCDVSKTTIYTWDYVLWLKKRIFIKDNKIEELENLAVSLSEKEKEIEELKTRRKKK